MTDSLTFCRLSRHPMVLEGQNHHHSTRRIETVRMVVVSSFYHHSLPRYVYKIAALLTFCRLSRHSVVIEGQNHHHSIRRIETVRMAVVMSFYHHSLLR